MQAAYISLMLSQKCHCQGADTGSSIRPAALAEASSTPLLAVAGVVLGMGMEEGRNWMGGGSLVGRLAQGGGGDWMQPNGHIQCAIPHSSNSGHTGNLDLCLLYTVGSADPSSPSVQLVLPRGKGTNVLLPHGD